jgi:hypothetical protein
MADADRPVFLVYPEVTRWMVRRSDARYDAAVRFQTYEAALLRARELADECRPSRIEVHTAKGMISLEYDV